MTNQGKTPRLRRPGIEAARERGPQLTLPPVDPNPEHATPGTEYYRWLTQLMTDLSQSLNGVALQGALPVPVGNDAGGRTLSVSASKSAGRLLGYSFVETTGNLVTVHFHDTDSTTPTDGAEVWHDQVPASGVRNLVGLNVSFSAGLGLELVTSGGAVRGIVLLSGVD